MYGWLAVHFYVNRFYRQLIGNSGVTHTDTHHFIIFMNEMESHFDTHKMREKQKRRVGKFQYMLYVCLCLCMWSGYLQSHTKYWVWSTSVASCIALKQHILKHIERIFMNQSNHCLNTSRLFQFLVSQSLMVFFQAGKQPK